MNVPEAVELTYVPGTAAAALAVRGDKKISDPAAQFGACTTVVAALAVIVNRPNAFDRPMKRSRTDRTTRPKSVSLMDGIDPLIPTGPCEFLDRDTAVGADAGHQHPTPAPALFLFAFGFLFHG